MIIHLSPMIPSYNLEETGKFFTEVLCFTAVMDTPEYAIYKKDSGSVHLLRAGQDIGQMEFYLEVDNIDELWSGIKDKISSLKHRPPFDREYGMREIHIAIPHTNTLLFIGQEIKQ